MLLCLVLLLGNASAGGALYYADASGLLTANREGGLDYSIAMPAASLLLVAAGLVTIAERRRTASPPPATRLEAPPLTVTAITDLEQLRALRPRWLALFDQSGSLNVFLTWDWIVACCEHWNGNPSTLVLTIERDGELVGVLPLVALGIGPFDDSSRRRRLRFATPHYVDEYAGLLCKPGYESQVLRASLQWLAKRKQRWHAIELCRVPEASPLRLLKERTFRDGLVHVVERAIPDSRCVNLPEKWEQLMKRSSYLKRLHQYVRRCVRETGARIEILEEPSQIAAMLPVLFDLHAQRWARRDQPSVFLPSRPFWDHVAPKLAESGMTKLFILRAADGSAMAAYLACGCGDRFFGLQTGFDPRWENYKVGTVVLAMVMEFAIGRGYRVFDFLGGDLEYKRFWSDHTQGKTTMVLYPMGFSGWCGAARQRCHENFRRASLRLATYEQRRVIKRRVMSLVGHA
jgi:CelD/BcsL family acetyltransferase involved in cellulose biosynthesis